MLPVVEPLMEKTHVEPIGLHTANYGNATRDDSSGEWNLRAAPLPVVEPPMEQEFHHEVGDEVDPMPEPTPEMLY